jgi:hypothetical protein
MLETRLLPCVVYRKTRNDRMKLFVIEVMNKSIVALSCELNTHVQAKYWLILKKYYRNRQVHQSDCYWLEYRVMQASGNNKNFENESLYYTQ